MVSTRKRLEQIFFGLYITVIVVGTSIEAIRSY